MCVCCACVVPTGAKQEAAGGGEKRAGYIILETNYHLTAYTGQQWAGLLGTGGVW